MLESMVAIPEAVKKAKESAQSVFEVPLAGIRLEDLYSGIADDQPVWFITLSIPRSVDFGVFAAPGHYGGRDYKTFTVSRDTGEVIAIKIREFAAA